MTDFLYDILIALPFSIFFTGICNLYFIADEKKIFSYLLSGVLCLFITGFFKMKAKWKIVSGSAFAGIILILLFIGKGDGGFDFLYDYIWCAVALATAAISYALSRVLTKYVRLKGAMAILVLAYLVFSMVSQKRVTRIDTASAGIIVLTALTELIQKYWQKEGYTDRKKHTVAVAPFFLAFFAVIAVVQAPKKPYDWQFFIDTGNAIKHGYIAITQKVFNGGKEGYLSVYGVFNDDGELHPDVSQSKNRVMAFTPNGYAPARMYLTGIVSDDFDGTTWTRKNNEDDNYTAIDCAESMYSAKMYAGDCSTDYLRTEGANIRLTYFNTQIVFAPSKTLLLKHFEEGIDFTQKEGSFYFDEMQGYGMEYDFRYAMFNYGSPDFRDFVNSEHPEDESSFNSFTYNQYYTAVQEVQYKDLLEYREYVKDVYLPDTVISDRAKALLDDITKDCVTDYDKCLAIEEYLHGFEYTWHPGNYPDYAKTPEGFLDYFLFENKQGYCAYYATAFVLMARAEGIPARYIQGYCVNTKGTKEVEIKGSMAHAWPEAYIEGVGWLRFEPTSGGNGTGEGYTPAYWATQEEINAEFEKRAEYYERMYSDNNDSNEERPDIDKKEREETEVKEKKNLALFFAIPAIMAVISLAAFTIAERAISKNKYRKASKEEKLRLVCKKNIALLKVAGYKYEKNETLEEFQNRLSKDLPTETLGFIILYEKLLYSGEAVTDGDEERARECTEAIFAEIKEKRGQLIYLVQRSISNIR